ncbi:MAG: heme exporter protein CcmB [Fidelibacterota bacterium]|nr:MAG: heme exporter protein CcmB [Candidatus Neomarinimicrobiota bacterium]
MTAFWTIFVKDLRLELRTRESMSAMVVFAAAVILLFAFAFDVAPNRFRVFTPGLMWMTYFFTAVLGLLRTFGQEREMEAYSLLLSAPVERGAIFLGKAAAFFVFLLAAQVVSLPLFGVFLSMPLLTAPVSMVLILVITDMAIAALGTLIAGMSLRSPMGEILLPVLAFPLLTPLLIASSKATGAALNGAPIGDWDFWLMLLVTYLVLFSLVGTYIFDYISEQ